MRVVFTAGASSAFGRGPAQKTISEGDLAAREAQMLDELVALAPDRIVALQLDAADSMQALWAARRYGAEAKFVVCNNHSYKFLDNNVEEYRRTQNIPEHDGPYLIEALV